MGRELKKCRRRGRVGLGRVRATTTEAEAMRRTAVREDGSSVPAMEPPPSMWSGCVCLCQTQPNLCAGGEAMSTASASK